MRSFTTSQILRRETVAVPKKRPVGAFRGGYVSAESYWRGRCGERSSVDSGGWLQCTAVSERNEKKNMKHQKEVWYDQWTDILEI